jgi:hypothetical protein
MLLFSLKLTSFNNMSLFKLKGKSVKLKAFKRRRLKA